MPEEHDVVLPTFVLIREAKSEVTSMARIGDLPILNQATSTFINAQRGHGRDQAVEVWPS